MKIVGALVVVALCLWVGLAGQQTQPFPGPTSGVVTVAGTVNVGNSPPVQAIQYGEWKVAVANTPAVRLAETATVRIARPSFLVDQRSYAITWGGGERETVRVLEIGVDGWVRVEQATGQRWINTSLARSIALVTP